WLSALKDAALEQLLLSEAQMARFAREGSNPGAAPAPPRVPAQSTLRSHGTERERRAKLSMWDRFAMADGVFATLARLVVAAAIVGAFVLIGTQCDEDKGLATLDDVQPARSVARPAIIAEAERSNLRSLVE